MRNKFLYLKNTNLLLLQVPVSSFIINLRFMTHRVSLNFAGHPQIKVFVYHCGMNGVWEAVYHGVPIVAVPLFADQFDNAQRIVSRGIGVKLDITTLTSKKLADAILEVANNPRYGNIHQIVFFIESLHCDRTVFLATKNYY